MKYDPNIVKAYWRACGIPAPELEYAFHPTRRFRADFCWPALRVIVECEGGIWMRGRHGRPAGIKGDMERGNEIAKLGYRLLRFEPKELCLQETADMIKATLKGSP